MIQRPTAPAAERNGNAIMAVLLDELTGGERVLEIGSGTGQHAVRFAAGLPGLFWQTSDLPENHAGITAWIEQSGCCNVAAPIALDVGAPLLLEQSYDAVFSANTAHIICDAGVERMFGVAGDVLPCGGPFLLYGPFKVGGRFSTESNKRFDRALRDQDPAMGVRDLETMDEYAGRAGLHRNRSYGMPANNMLVVWRKTAGVVGQAR